MMLLGFWVLYMLGVVRVLLLPDSNQSKEFASLGPNHRLATKLTKFIMAIMWPPIIIYCYSIAIAKWTSRKNTD